MQGLRHLRRFDGDAAQTTAAAAVLQLAGRGRLDVCNVRAVVYPRVCRRALRALQMPRVPILRSERPAQAVAAAAAALAPTAPAAPAAAAATAAFARICGL